MTRDSSRAYRNLFITYLLWVAEWPPFGKELLTRFLYFDVITRFGFEGWIWVLIASFPRLCILFTFTSPVFN